MAPRLLVLAPDPSGDMLAAPLAAAWIERTGGRVTALGGPALAAAGARVVWDQGPFATLGFADAIAALPRTWIPARQAITAATEHDVVMVADARWFLERAAPVARRAGARVAWLAPSPDWRRRGPTERTERLAALADLLLVTDPLARAAYPDRSVWMGHPGLAAAADIEAEREEVLALFPGSRKGEVSRLLPMFLDAAERAGRMDATVVSDPFGLVGALPDGVRRDCGEAAALLAKCRVALAASGTLLQEAVVTRTPVVASYLVSPVVSWWVYLTRGRPRHWTHPNLLAGREVVPEFIQERAEPVAIAESVSLLWEGGRREACLRGLEDIRREYLGGEGVEAAARALTALAKA